MDLIDQIMNQARNVLACPICSAHYDSNQIKFRGFIDNTYIFQAYCNKNHEPVAITYLASLQKIDKPISSYFHTLSGEKITNATVQDIENVLNDFNDKVDKLWMN